jgi:Beta-ketoacyl synthase, N-terminal domain
MSAYLVSYAEVSARGIGQMWADGKRMIDKFTRWETVGAADPDVSGLPPLKGRYFCTEPTPRFGRMDLLCKLGLCAAELCMAHAPELTRKDVALIGGSMLGCLEVDAQYHDTLLKGGPAGASPALFVYTLPSMFLGEIAIKFGLRGRTSYINAGTLSAIAAFANGVRLIETGREQAVLVVAAEASGTAAGQLELNSLGYSGAAAWLLTAQGPGWREIRRVRFGIAEGMALEKRRSGLGLTYVPEFELALTHITGAVHCGKGADTISIELAPIER